MTKTSRHKGLVLGSFLVPEIDMIFGDGVGASLVYRHCHAACMSPSLFFEFRHRALSAHALMILSNRPSFQSSYSCFSLVVQWNPFPGSGVAHLCSIAGMCHKTCLVTAQALTSPDEARNRSLHVVRSVKQADGFEALLR